MSELISIRSEKDIPKELLGTPIASLLRYHNLDEPFKTYSTAELLVGMCIDNRKHLHMPDNFAYIIRTAGANMRQSDFKISFAIGVGGVAHMVLLGHTQCGMENLASKKETFVEGLIARAGWSKVQAEEQFQNFLAISEIGTVAEFILSEAARIRARYPKIKVAPFIYRVEDNLIYAIRQ